MAFLETKHTLSRVSKIKKDLIKVMLVVSYISIAAILAYYIYLAIQNINEYLYLTIYSCLIVLILSLFIVELTIKENKKILKNEKRLIAEKKRRCKAVIKIIKFIAKSALVGIAIYETFTNFNLTLSNVINICSAVILVVQILLEIVINYIIKQIDYFRLSAELDLEESGAIIKKIMKIINPLKNSEEEAIKANNGMLYSSQELKMIDEIKVEADKYIKEKQEKEKQIKQMLPQKNKKVKKTIISKVLKRKVIVEA